MRRFQDNGQWIHITDDSGQEFTATVEEFQGYEGTYQTVADGQIRIWTPDAQYMTDGNRQRGDPFYTPERFASYISSIAAYQAAWTAAHQSPPGSLEELRLQMLRDWNHTVNTFICGYFDAGTQQSFAAIFTDLVDKQQTTPLTAAELQAKAALKAVKAWVEAVMGYYYQVKAQLEAAAAMEHLQAIDGDFESEFGVNGTLHAVPPVTLRQFLG